LRTARCTKKARAFDGFWRVTVAVPLPNLAVAFTSAGGSFWSAVKSA